MFVRNLGHNRRGRVRPCAEIAAVTGNIRRGIATGNLADCLCERQTGYITAETDIRSRRVSHQRIQLTRRSPDTQVAVLRDCVVDLVIIALVHTSGVKRRYRQNADGNKILCFFRNILFKGGASLEALNNVKTIVMDKTGTITKGNFVVQKVVPAQGVPLDENELLWLAAACEGASTHPIAKSIINSYEERKTSAAKAGDFSLVAVGATVENIREQAGEGVFAELEGKTILCGNVKLMECNNIDLSGYHGTPGSTEVLLAMDGHFLGHVDISDTIKADANSAISRMKAQGLTTAMLTGDGQASADAVAQEVGIDEVRARLLPQDKLSALTDIREKCGAVMFVGDGINDAPVLAGADVGAAMGSGADAAIEAADVVFMKADLTSIPISVKIARKANIVSKENIVFALAVKILVMILGLFGIASMWLAVFADTGVAMLCVLNSIRMLYMKTE